MARTVGSPARSGNSRVAFGGPGKSATAAPASVLMIRSGDAKMMSLEIKRLNGEVLDRSE
ncbi:hypothetical protein LBMAG57_10550 [Verrucomicrobiota bacterium]|nr:hypothetical protein LBMAG57_10550 [Verrucomicrobiota bacterium]